MAQDGINTASWSRAQSESGQAELYLQLLGEYAPKLWQLCREYGERRRRRLTRIAGLGVGLLISIGVAPLVFKLYKFDPAWEIQLLLSGLFVIGILGSAFVGWTQLVWQSSDHLVKMDMKILGEKVKRLVAVASQFNEHVESDPARKLQFDFRLLEAEASLRLCDAILRRSERISEDASEQPVLVPFEDEKHRASPSAFPGFMPVTPAKK